MSRLKRLASAAVSVAMAAVMLTSCSTGRYCMTYSGDKNVNSGIYIYNIISELLNQQYVMYYSGSSDNVMDKKVDGKEMAVYLEENALKNTKAYCAITAKFDELGLKLSDEDTKSISSSTTNAYNAQKEMFEEMGISKDSIKQVLTQTKKRDMLFDYYYGKDGKEAVSDDELIKYVNENYLRYKTLSISKSTSTDDSTEDKENKEHEETINKYFSKAQSGSFDGFDAVIEEYNAEVEAKAKETSDSSSNADSSSSSDSSSKADSSSTADSSSSKVGDADSSSKTDSSSNSDSSSKADSSSSSDSSETDHDHEAEESKYKNENMVNYAQYDEDALSQDYGKLITEVKNMKAGSCIKYSNDKVYYIIYKGDVTERSKEYVADNRETILKEMKNEDFDKLIEEWEGSLDIKVDDKSIRRYSAKSLYERYTDYSSSKK